MLSNLYGAVKRRSGRLSYHMSRAAMMGVVTFTFSISAAHANDYTPTVDRDTLVMC